ncbi:hypothetical protein KEM54_006575 [Ascosphaera aggregata]|nr:hypothetical protein KEM54_006575 [Ascosphaera aggregata]
MSVDIPDFIPTPLNKIPIYTRQLRDSFIAGKTRDVGYRITQLRKFYWALKDREEKFLAAAKKDLNKPAYETLLTEYLFVLNEIIFVCDNLKKWMKPEKLDDVDLTFSIMRPVARKDPLGTVLIIGAYNFPFLLTLLPVIGAIAAGNTVVLKPSELSSNCAAIIQDAAENSLDISCYRCIQGGVPETQALLAEKWDKICYTGGGRVAKIVAQAAAPNLTPLLLELGGRNPAFVTKSADVELAARRLAWGKCVNAGQVCVSQNYMLVDKTVLDTFIAALKQNFQEFYPDGVENSPDYGRIVNINHFRRIKGMVDSTRGEIIYGGRMDEKTLFIEPTIIMVSSADDPVLAEESFGPLFSILPVDNVDEAIDIANGIDPTPLGCYAFGNSAETEKILSRFRSGGASINDSFMHASIANIPFGGVGSSGMGSYRGKYSFDAFVHRRTVTSTPLLSFIEKALFVRYAPYKGKEAIWRGATERCPNFDREGKSTGGLINWMIWIVTLGGGKTTHGVKRSAIAVAGE